MTTDTAYSDFSQLPRDHYEIVLADPPWSYYGDPNKDQAAGKHYPTMTVEQMLSAFPVREITKDPSVMFMWATCPKLPDALALMERFGYHYRGVAYVWVKTNALGKPIGGQGVRPSFVKPTTEFVLIGSTWEAGRVFPLLTEAQHQVIMAPRPGGVHSAKPHEVHDRIVSLLGDRPRLEMFARTPRPGWDTFGNETKNENSEPDVHGLHWCNVCIKELKAAHGT